MKTLSLGRSLGLSCSGPSRGCRAEAPQPPEPPPDAAESRFILHQLSFGPSTLLKNLLISESNFKGIAPASQKEGFAVPAPLPAHHCEAWVFLAA